MKLLLLPVTQSCIYWGVAVIVSVLYGLRGILIQQHHVAVENAQNASQNLPQWTLPELVLTHYAQDFVYNAICSFAGFVALFVEVKILIRISDFNSIGAGVSVLLVFLSLISVSGIGGVLPRILYHGLFKHT